MTNKIFKDIDPVSGQQVYRQTHADAVIFDDGENLSEKIENINNGEGTITNNDSCVYTEDVLLYVSNLGVNVPSINVESNFILLEADSNDSHNGVITVVKALTQGRFGWDFGRLLPLDVKVEVDVVYDGTGTTQGYYANDKRTPLSNVSGSTISKNVTHLSFIVNNKNARYVYFTVTNLQAGKTITFSNFSATYYSKYEDANKFLQDDYDTDRLLKVSTSSSTLALLHFSDIHSDCNAAAKIRRFYDRNQSRINNMLSTGDVVNIKFSDEYSFYTLNELGDALFSLGNHDGATSDSEWYGVERSEVYARYITPNVSNWNVVQPTGAAENYLFYWYKDYSAATTRLICLDGVHQDADQLTWFLQCLADTLDSSNSAYGYKVVICSHYVPGTFEMQGVVKNALEVPVNFSSATWELSSIQAYAQFDTAYPTAVENFIANNGKFVVWLCGHYHTSTFTYLKNYPNILVSCIDQAGTLRNHSLYRENDIPTETACANVVIVSNTLLRFIRVGYHRDGRLRPIHALCYDWVNKKVVSES